MSFFIVTLGEKKTTLVHGSRTCGVLEVTSFWAHLFCVSCWILLGMILWKTPLLLGRKYRTLSLCLDDMCSMTP